MNLKHQVQINVTSNQGNNQMVMKSGIRTLPKRLVKWLFGEDTQILVMTSGQSVDSVEIREVGGKPNEQN